MAETKVANKTEEERIAFIDWAKAICIFLMVVGHHENNRIIMTYIFAFHMPAFFVVSGFLYKPHSWMKTLITIAFPIVIISLVNCFVYPLIGIYSTDSLSFQFLTIHFIQWRHGLGESLFKGIWFIWVLVGLRFIVGDIIRRKMSHKIYLPVTIIIIIYMSLEEYHVDINTLFRGYYIGLIIPSFPFFCFGLFLKEMRWHPKYISQKTMIPLALLFIMLPVTNNYCDIYNGNYGYSYIIATTNALLFTLLLFGLVNRLPSSSFIQTISKGTLIVLGTHMPILRILGILLPERLSFTFPFITIYLCYYIIIACERYCPMLLGKSRSFAMFSGKSKST